MQTSIYKYPTYYQIIKAIVSLIVIGVIILSVLGLYSSLSTFLSAPPIYENVDPSPQYYFLIALPILCVGIPLVFFLVSVLLVVNTIYPAIGINDRGLRIYTFFGLSKFVSWESIQRIRSPKLSIGGLLFIGARGLGLAFFPSGLLLLIGSGGFLISSKISQYGKLVAQIKEKRPDLLV